ncbi:hypothetical protein [Robertmurraya andreesenii]|uniref:Permease n=1 Tax=Anoxybacillus andreesenii TaxID=1325932 RepID=A0ABT9V8K6_9BACL|nr:hypothetical protein [Robertmurraya andreesenii]MDQ0157286.1 hypothetical protein [Robertmurraya andreesenii]
MNKNRYLLCLLGCGAMLYYALPRLPVLEGSMASVFAISWLVLCLFVIAGNLSALLYAPKKSKAKPRPLKRQMHKKIRQYY